MSPNCDTCASLWRKYAALTAEYFQAEKGQAADPAKVVLLAARQKVIQAIRQHEMVDHPDRVSQMTHPFHG